MPYATGENWTLYAGECSEVMQDCIADESVDLVVTSPPYDNLREYNGFILDWRKIIEELYRVIKPGGICVWVVADATTNGGETLTSFEQALYARDCGFNQETMIYEQAGTGAKGSNYYYWQSFEFMFVWVKGQPKTSNRIQDIKNSVGGKKRGFSPKSASLGSRVDRKNVIAPLYSVRSNVWRYPVGSNGETEHHPAPFPEALAHDHILSWSNPGDLILDPMCGSGTVQKMALMTGRKTIGIDISSEYLEIAKRRINLAWMPLLNSYS